MRLIKLAISLSAAALLLASCEEEKDPIDVTKRAFLYDRAWNLTEHLYTTNVDEEFPTYTDVLSSEAPCKYDDFYFFTTKSEGFYSDYFVRCDPALPEQTAVYLNISADDQTITVYSDPDDMWNSLMIFGTMTTPHIDTFKVTHRFWDEDTETNHEVIKTFVVTHPTDI